MPRKKDPHGKGIFRKSFIKSNPRKSMGEEVIFGPKREESVRHRIELKARKDLEMAAKIRLNGHRIPAEHMENAKYEDVETARRAVESKFSGMQGWPKRMTLKQKKAYLDIILKHGREAAFNLAEANIVGTYNELRTHVKKKK